MHLHSTCSASSAEPRICILAYRRCAPCLACRVSASPFFFRCWALRAPLHWSLLPRRVSPHRTWKLCVQRMLQLRARLPSRGKSGHWCERQMQLRACLQPIYGFAEQCSRSFACAFAPCALLVCAWLIRASARQHQVACSWRALAAAKALLRSSSRLWASVVPRRPPPEDSHDLNYDLLLAGLPADPRVAWLRLNRGSFTVRRILALLRLGTHAIHFYHRAPEVDRPPAFVITFGVLGVSGCFVALEPDADVAGFLLP